MLERLKIQKTTAGTCWHRSKTLEPASIIIDIIIIIIIIIDDPRSGS